VLLPSVRVEDCTRIEKAQLVSLFHTGNRVEGGAEQASMRLICGWKAPWVRQIVSFFAEGCLKRPWRVTLAWFAAGELVHCICLSDTPGGWHLQPCIQASLRQKVLERIGLGLSLLLERSRWRECAWQSRGTPLAREVSVGPSRKGRCHPPKQRSVEGSHQPRSARGPAVSAVVVAGRFGCRN
jgi:hypothetical protein